MLIFKNRKTGSTATMKSSTESSVDVKTADISENSNEVNDMDNSTLNELNAIIVKQWKEEEKDNASYEWLFKQLVDEAVYAIKDAWKQRAKYSQEAKLCKGKEITLRSYDTFFVSADDRKLYSSAPFVVIYPKTNKSCFFKTILLQTSEDEQRFVDSVLSKLPEGTSYEVREEKESPVLAGNHYSFEITFMPKA